MSKTVRSMRGEIIDLDLLKIKQQIATAPKPVNVQEREQFVDKKIRRRVRRQKVVDSDLDIDETIKEDLHADAEVEPSAVPAQTAENSSAEKKRPVRKRK